MLLVGRFYFSSVFPSCHQMSDVYLFVPLDMASSSLKLLVVKNFYPKIVELNKLSFHIQ